MAIIFDTNFFLKQLEIIYYNYLLQFIILLIIIHSRGAIF